MAGTIKIFLFEANNTVDARSSLNPSLNFDIVFAVAGTTIIKSTHLDNEI